MHRYFLNALSKKKQRRNVKWYDVLPLLLLPLNTERHFFKFIHCLSFYSRDDLYCHKNNRNKILDGHHHFSTSQRESLFDFSLFSFLFLLVTCILNGTFVYIGFFSLFILFIGFYYLILFFIIFIKVYLSYYLRKKSCIQKNKKKIASTN